MRLFFQVTGDETAERHLLRLGQRAANPRVALELVAEDMRTALRQRFAAQGYGTWAALKPSTVAAKAQAGLDPRILHATHAMRDSLTGAGGGNFSVVIGNTLVFGTSDEKATHHQRGTSNMPARKPLDFRYREVNEFARTVQRYLVEGAAEAALGTQL